MEVTASLLHGGRLNDRLCRGVYTMRYVPSALMLIVLAGATSARAQDWARQMFKESRHDFGTVARFAKTEFAFSFNNPYVEDVHVASVRSSCGCTSVRVEKPTLKTYETSAIVATFNTHLFYGKRGATITVTFDKPFYAEVQLQVAGVIRSDLVLDPGSVILGTVEQGHGAEAHVAVQCHSRSIGPVTVAKPSSPYLTAQITPRAQGNSLFGYDLAVSLSPDAPVGYVNETLLLNTGDGATVPLAVEGRIESAISVSPSPLFLGACEPGASATKQLIVKGAKPFRVVSAECSDPAVEVDCRAGAAAAKTLHIIPVRFTAGASSGAFQATVRLQTDAADRQPIEVPVFAKVGQ